MQSEQQELGTSLNNYCGHIGSMQAIAKGVKGLLQHSKVLSRGVQRFEHVERS